MLLVIEIYFDQSYCRRFRPPVSPNMEQQGISNFTNSSSPRLSSGSPPSYLSQAHTASRSSTYNLRIRSSAECICSHQSNPNWPAEPGFSATGKQLNYII